MRAPYRQSDSADITLRQHGCTLFSTLYCQREESRGDVSPTKQEDVDEHVRVLRRDAGVSAADFLRRGTTLTEADRAYEAQTFPGRLPPLMRTLHGVPVREELLPLLRAGRVALIAVNYGVIQDAGKGVGSFRGGHAVVIGEPENGAVAVADPLRLVIVRWSVDLLVKSMETFGERPWGNGRGEAGVPYPSPTYRQAYASSQKALADARQVVERRTAMLEIQRKATKEAEGDRDRALAAAKATGEQLALSAEALEKCLARPLDCSIPEGERDRALARIEAAKAALEDEA